MLLRLWFISKIFPAMAEENITMLRDDLKDLPEITLPEGYILTTFRPGDEERWVALMREVFPESDWTLEKFQEEFGSKVQFDPEGLFFIVKDGEYVASALGWRDTPEEKVVGRVHWVGVRSDQRGKGLGKAVVLAVLHYLKRKGFKKAILDTQTYRPIAINLYKSLGFRIVK